MTDPIKIWKRIVEAFIDIEVNDIAVKTIALPLKCLKIIEKRPMTLKYDSWRMRGLCDMLCYVENPASRKHKKIWAAQVIIGKHIKARG